MKVIDDITEFIFVKDELEEADILFIPGGSYAELGEKAALLWKQGGVPLILPSGKYSPSRGMFSGVLSKQTIYNKQYETEWAFFKDVLLINGVPEEAILREDTAEYTYQNAFRSREVTDGMGLAIKKAIICCKSFHARRCLMYYQWAYPDTKFMVCPCDVQGITRDNWYESEKGVDRVLGELTKCGAQFKTAVMAMQNNKS